MKWEPAKVGEVQGSGYMARSREPGGFRRLDGEFRPADGGLKSLYDLINTDGLVRFEGVIYDAGRPRRGSCKVFVSRISSEGQSAELTGSGAPEYDD